MYPGPGPGWRGAGELNDPIQRYAFEREAEHLWALGETDGALKFSGREPPVRRATTCGACGCGGLFLKADSAPITRTRS